MLIGMTLLCNYEMGVDSKTRAMNKRSTPGEGFFNSQLLRGHNVGADIEGVADFGRVVALLVVEPNRERLLFPVTLGNLDREDELARGICSAHCSVAIERDLALRLGERLKFLRDNDAAHPCLDDPASALPDGDDHKSADEQRDEDGADDDTGGDLGFDDSIFGIHGDVGCSDGERRRT